MEEAASVARTPATCLEVWSGDHRQTPGGLKKSKESKAFRKKLTKRPLALRCQTQYIQAHDLGDIAMRYLDCPKDTFAWKLPQLLAEGSTAIDPAVGQFWQELIGDSPHVSLEKSSVRPLPSCGWVYGAKEKLFLACLPPRLLKRQEWLVAKNGVWCSPAAHGSLTSHIKRLLEWGIRNWSHSMEQVGSLVSTFPMRDRNEVASSLFFGTFHVPTYML